MASERKLQAQIRELLGRVQGCVFWRNNVGVADYNGNKVRYGLAKGSSDLIGMVDGRFAALEIKTPKGRPTEEQQQFLRCVRRNGGFAAIVRSPEEALAAVYRCREGEDE